MRRGGAFPGAAFVVVVFAGGPALTAAPAAAETLRFADVLAEALARSPTVRASRARVGLAEAEEIAARRLLRTNPNLEIEYASGTLLDDHGDLQASVVLEQEVEIGGQRGLRRERAAALRRAADARASESEARVAREAAAVFFRLWRAARAHDLAREIVEVNRALARAAAARRPEVAAARSDVAAAVAGKVVPRTDRHAQIFSPVAGRVLAPVGGRMPLVGQRVRRGQVLTVIEQSLSAPDAAGLATERIKADAAVARERATLDQARRDLERMWSSSSSCS